MIFLITVLFFSTCVHAQANFVVDFSSGVFTINGVSQATVNVEAGKTYVFDCQNSSAHPFYLSTDPNGGGSKGEYTDGVTGSMCANGLVLTWVVPSNPPDPLYYQCANHSNMGGDINVTSSGSNNEPGAVTALKKKDRALNGTLSIKFKKPTENPEEVSKYQIIVKDPGLGVVLHTGHTQNLSYNIPTQDLDASKLTDLPGKVRITVKTKDDNGNVTATKAITWKLKDFDPSQIRGLKVVQKEPRSWLKIRYGIPLHGPPMKVVKLKMRHRATVDQAFSSWTNVLSVKNSERIKITTNDYDALQNSLAEIEIKLVFIDKLGGSVSKSIVYTKWD